MEFVVCLIPIIFVFSGLILVAVLGRANVQNTIQARSAVDLGKNHGSARAEDILNWNYGKDQVPFTGDDKPNTGAVSYYSSEDMTTEKYTVTDTFIRNKSYEFAQIKEAVGFYKDAATLYTMALKLGHHSAANDLKRIKEKMDK